MSANLYGRDMDEDVGDFDMPRWWTVVSESAAVQWEGPDPDDEAPGSGNGVTVAKALIIYNDISSDALRSLQWGRIHPWGLPRWKGDDVAPTERQIRELWEEASTAIDEHPDPEPGMWPRGDLELIDAFYRRVATFYKWAIRNTGAPTQALADVTDVPKSTAARWVREARARGLLPKTTQGKARA